MRVKLGLPSTAMTLIAAFHRWTGGLIGLLLAMLGLSGAILVHKDEWVALPHASDAQIQGIANLAELTQRIMEDPATRPESILFATKDFGLDRLTYKGGAGAYVDQNGGFVARWTSQWERPEIWLFDFHHHLFAGETGEIIIGLAAVCGLFFVVTGAFLWWRTRRTYSFRLWPARMSRPAIIRHHRDLGIIMAPLLALSLLTGAILVFRPLSALLFGSGALAQIERALSEPASRPVRLAEGLRWSAMIETARRRFPEAEVRSLSLPRQGNGLITLRMRSPEEWLPNGRTTLWFAADSGALVATRNARNLPPAARGYNLLYPLHAAKVGGFLYRLTMTLSGLALTLLGTLAVWVFWFRRLATIRGSD
jgi:uncharacterized iron-regulated membrane protein